MCVYVCIEVCGMLRGGCRKRLVGVVVVRVWVLRPGVMRVNPHLQEHHNKLATTPQGYMWRLRYAGDFKDTSARESDGTVGQGLGLGLGLGLTMRQGLGLRV